MVFDLTQSRRLQLVIGISFSFFIAEISVGFYTKSLALIADAFHYLNDLLGFIVAYAALKVSEQKESPKFLSFGWQRSRVLGAFFNGVFLLALGVSIFLQSIERFVSVEKIEQPKLVVIIGCIGLGLNILSACFLHDHGHSHGHCHGHSHGENTSDVEIQHRSIHMSEIDVAHNNHRHKNVQPPKKGYDLGMLGVLIHVLGDAANNVGVIISGLIIWLTKYPGRFYADPAVSMVIALIIFMTSLPLVRHSGRILLDSVPIGTNLEDIKHDLETIPGILSVHDLHVRQLNQEKSQASVRVVISDKMVAEFAKPVRTVEECLHGYGIHSATVQAEFGQYSTSFTSTTSKKEGN